MHLNTREILKEKSECSKELTNEKEALAKLFKVTISLVLIIGVILETLLIPKILEEYTGTLNFFGLEIEVENPLLLAFFLIVIISSIAGSLISVHLIFIKFLSAKIEMLDNTYRTMLLTEQLVNILSSNKAETYNDESDSESEIFVDKTHIAPVKILKGGSGKTVCPVCGTEQNDNRYCCFHCSTPFINERPDAQYYCSNCGFPGPFEGNCPNCNSDKRAYDD